jgi:hypothetical protein
MSGSSVVDVMGTVIWLASASDDRGAVGHGQLYPIASHRDVAPALVRAFSA